MNKIVSFPIEVPDCDYCWDGHISCQYYDNEGGHSTCDLGFFQIKSDTYGKLKPPECKHLTDIVTL